AAGVAGVKRGQGKRIHRRDDAARRTKSKRRRDRLVLFLSRSISESRDVTLLGWPQTPGCLPSLVPGKNIEIQLL
ncbi:MAG TPA: hypothetical protein VLM18_06660, partial [Croceibacterium sp.]|nr:hypothetical protein [Croceibacterium sp.]